MDPSVEAAWIVAIPSSIAIISTAVVAIISSRNTRQSAVLGLDAAHDMRVWEKKADVYVECVLLIQRTQFALGQVADPETFNAEFVRKGREFYDDIAIKDWPFMIAQVTALAPQIVSNAMGPAATAQMELVPVLHAWMTIRNQRRPGTAVSKDETVAYEAARAAAKAASERLNELLTLIRADLARRPSTAAPVISATSAWLGTLPPDQSPGTRG